MKMFWFFNATTAIPWSFKMCGIFQMCCDMFLGIQYLMYGNGGSKPVLGNGEMKKIPLAPFRSPSHASTPIIEKDTRLE